MDWYGRCRCRHRRDGPVRRRDLTLIRNAAAELPRVDLGDALAVCVAIRTAEPDRHERAALRWLARYCLERREATHAHVQIAWAFENLADEQAALEMLERLCSRWLDESRANLPEYALLVGGQRAA